MPALPRVTTEQVIGRKPCWNRDEVREAAQALPEHATVIERVKAFRHVLMPQELLWLVCSEQMMPLECGIRWAEWCDKALGARGFFLRRYGLVDPIKGADVSFRQISGCVLKMLLKGLGQNAWGILLDVLVDYERR